MDEVQEEIDRRWPSPNSGLYEGLRIGFRLGVEWANEQRTNQAEQY